MAAGMPRPVLASSSFCVSLLLVAATLAHCLSDAAQEVELQGAVQGPRQKLCEACLQAVLQLQLVLSQPDLATTSVNVLEEAVCAKLPDPGLAAQCNEAVEMYVPVILEQLKREVTIENICVEKTKLCPPQPPPPGPAAVQSPEECYACRLVVKLLKSRLEDPKVQAKIEEYVDAKCSLIANATRAAQCQEAVDKFLPVFFANLEVILNGKKLCKEAGLCLFATPAAIAS